MRIDSILLGLVLAIMFASGLAARILRFRAPRLAKLFVGLVILFAVAATLLYPPPFSLSQIGLLGAFLFAALYYFSYQSGWRRLAETFPFQGTHESDLVPIHTATVGGVPYSVNAKACSHGLHLSALLPFHHALLVPWSEITVDSQVRSSSNPRVTLSTSWPTPMQCQLPAIAWNDLQQRIPSTRLTE